MSKKTSEGEAAYLKPYRQALDHFGPSFEATLWFNEKAQVTRLDVLTDMLDPQGKRALDAGCARGELAHRLVEVGKIPTSFAGLDAFRDFTDAARKQAPKEIPSCHFEAVDFVREADAFSRFEPDVVYFSGSLNTLSQAEALAVVERAYAAAKVGVAFNFLSTRHHPRFDDVDLGPARRFDAAEIVRWALERTFLVRYRQDYFDGHDASLAMRKPDE
jgi:hypothetical protein